MINLVPVLSEKEIKVKVIEVAKKITKDYKDKELVVIGVLKGSFIFLSDLVRNISQPLQIDFVSVSSYGNSDKSSGNVLLLKEISIDVKNRDLLIVEDIVDTGLTLNFLVEYFQKFKPRSIKICTFINKLERRLVDIPVDYICHSVYEGFFVGYGLDYAEKYRNLPQIYHLKFNQRG